MKALKKKPADRYSTVVEFADDIRRFLAGEPVQARPDSAFYRLRKFARRNRLAVGAAAIVVCALGIGLARGARYIVLGYLAIRYGDQGLELMRTHGPAVALWLVGLIVAAVAAFWVWKKVSSARLASQRG